MASRRRRARRSGKKRKAASSRSTRTARATAAVDPGSLILPQAQFVQAHNTYAYYGRRAVATGFEKTLDDLYEVGIRGIELDAWQKEGDWQWSVGHSGGYRSGQDVQLNAYLQAIAAWSEERHSQEGHEPLVLFIEMKDDTIAHGFPDAFDKYLRTALARCVLLPPGALLHSPDERLVEAIRDNSRWPTLSMMRNTLVVCLSGAASRNEMYASANHALRLAFADHPASFAPGDPTEFMGPNRIVLSIGAGPGGFLGNWQDVLRRAAKSPRALPRIWWDHIELIGVREHIGDSVAALDGGAWCVATDSAHDLMPELGWGGYRVRR